MSAPGPYHLIPMIILLVLAYAGSLLAVRMQITGMNRHRRFWNLVLLLFFLSSSLLGLFLAVKVNYKLNIPWIDAAMKWHVDMGIGLALVAIFHLTWHLSYYWKALQFKNRPVENETLKPYLNLESSRARILFILLGLNAMITQLALLREYLKSLHGNELVIGLFLAIWMILTAAGARAGTLYRAKLSATTLLKSFLILSVLPFIICFMLLLATRYIFPPGLVPGILPSVSFMLLILPFTILSGFLFAYMVRVLKPAPDGTACYMLESAGALAGGMLFGLVLVFLLGNIQVMALVLLSTVLILGVFYRYPADLKGRIPLILAALAVFTTLLFPGTKKWLEEMNFRGEKVLDTRDTPQGSLTFTDRDGLITGYLDRNPVISSYDPAACEEQVHYAALQHPDPESFLLIGGGIQGLDSEIAKYNPRIFHYCDANRWMHRMGQEHLPGSATYSYIGMDGRNWLAEADTIRYDIIISTAGEPLTLGWNRYFTKEFFQMVKSRLNPGGVFSFHMPSGGNYISESGGNLLGTAYRTVEEVFDHVTVIPGLATYFLASDHPLSLDIPALYEQKEIPTEYVNPDYMDASRLLFESDLLVERMKEEGGSINRDLQPILFFKSISEWNLRTEGKRLIYIALSSLLILILLLISNSRQRTGMFVAGFTGAGMQVVLILVVQSFYGFAYLVTPLMITLFMGGLVTGTVVWKAVWKNPSLSRITGLMWILALTAAAAVVLLKAGSLFRVRWIGMPILAFLNFLPGLLVGSVFGISQALERSNSGVSAGRLYSADLAGAAMGNLIPPIFLVPLIGVPNTFILFCGISVAAGLYLQTGRKVDSR
jgi:spermidine synthase